MPARNLRLEDVVGKAVPGSGLVVDDVRARGNSADRIGMLAILEDNVPADPPMSGLPLGDHSRSDTPRSRQAGRPLLSRRTDDCIREAERLTAPGGATSRTSPSEITFHLATDID